MNWTGSATRAAPISATLATTTPIANSLPEMYVMHSYLQPEVMERAGVAGFDGWAANFAGIISAAESSRPGGGLDTEDVTTTDATPPTLTTSPPHRPAKVTSRRPGKVLDRRPSRTSSQAAELSQHGYAAYAYRWRRVSGNPASSPRQIPLSALAKAKRRRPLPSTRPASHRPVEPSNTCIRSRMAGEPLELSRRYLHAFYAGHSAPEIERGGVQSGDGLAAALRDGRLVGPDDQRSRIGFAVLHPA